MAAPTITNGQEHFFPLIYEGNSAGQRVGNFVPFTDSGVISNSCIFNGATNNYLARTPSSNGSGTTLTFSCWVKRGLLGLRDILYNGNITSNSEHLHFDANNKLNYYEAGGGARKWDYVTTRTFEDTSKWYHIYVRRDTTDSTAADRIQIYVDGERVTAYDTETQPALNATGYWNQTTYGHYLGTTGSASYIRGIGYLAEVNMIDGSNPAVSTFGVTDTSTGRWVPKALTGITYGTNGFRLQFGSPSAIGDDTSGNNNDWSVNDLVASDLTTDSPTQNHTTLNPLKSSNITLSEGNLKASTVSGAQSYASGSLIPLTSGKYYSEITITTAGSTLFFVGVGNFNDYLDHYTADNPLSKIAGGYIRSDTGQAYTAHNDVGTYHTYGNSFTTNDVIGIAIDVDKGAMWISKNGTWQNSATASEIADGNTSNSLRTGMKGPLIILNNTHSGTTVDYNFGQRSFSYTAPTGYNSIQQDNLPSTVKDITDFVIIKNRDAADSWMWQDSLRGSGQYGSTSTATQYNTAITDGVQKFLAGGFSTEDNDAINTSGESYVAHNFHLNGGTTTTDTSGDLSTELQANATAGFSVGKFTVSGSGNVTWAHGLGGVPEMGILCAFDSTNYGTTYHHKTSSTPYNEYLLTTTDATVGASAGIWGSAKPTSTLWTGLVNSLFTAGGVYVFYSFRSIEGFSKFSSYTGNGNADGPFVYLGFRPAYVMIKRLTAGYHWTEKDTSRNPINPMTRDLKWNLTAAENVDANNAVDFLSNGFKIRSASSGATNYNGSGATHIYMAFAEHPFVGDGTNPVTAR
jgi:hypothetical protein